MPSVRLDISLIETPQFRRFVKFASDVQAHAVECKDLGLFDLVMDLHRDLLDMQEGPDDE